MNSAGTQSAWLNRTVDLSGYAGKTVAHLWVTADAATPVGAWNIWYGEIAIYSADGTVTPVYDRQPSTSFSYFSGGGETNTNASVTRSNTANDAKSSEVSATYYLSDQINSVRATLAAGGWPVSMDTYYPYGVEPVASGAPDHYKFSGKERDQESGNDDFGARYYSPVMGRFMSPDWSADPEAMPYADLMDPQSFNRYVYLNGNPVGGIDPDGHCGVGDANAGLTEGYVSKEITAPCTVVDGIEQQNSSLSGSQAVAPCPHNNCNGFWAGTGMAGSGYGTPHDREAPDMGATPNVGCQATLLNMANQQLGTNFDSSNVTGFYNNGAAYNIIIQSSHLTPRQFNNIQLGRYTTSRSQWLTGFGLAGHIADETNLGFAQSAFQHSNVGGDLSVRFAFHDDHGYANNPFGAFIHWSSDVLGHSTRKPC